MITGAHQFSFAVLPHVGSFLESDVPQAGYLFNSPLQVRKAPTQAVQEQQDMLRVPPFAVFGAPNVFLETVKRGEEDSESGKHTIILRLYEAFGGHAQARLRINGSRFNVSSAFLTNILEEEDQDTELNIVSSGTDGDAEVQLDFRGFEFKTVKVVVDTSKKNPNVFVSCFFPPR
jgi:alpha-mannosidase